MNIVVWSFLFFLHTQCKIVMGEKSGNFCTNSIRNGFFSPFKMTFVVNGHYHWLNNDFNFCNLFDLWTGNKIDH